MYRRGIISHLTCAIIQKSGARRAGASAPPSSETISAWPRCMSEMRAHFSDNALEAPLTVLPPDIAESCHFFRMAIKNLDQADGSFAGRHCTTLILLERSPSAADDPASFLLRQTQLLTNVLDPRRISHAQFAIGAFTACKSSPEWIESLSSSGYQPATSTSCDKDPTQTVCARMSRRRSLPVSGWSRVWATGYQYTFKVYFGQWISRRCGTSF